MQLRGVFYNWIDRESHGDQVNIGFIAQELEPYFPELVRESRVVSAQRTA